MATGPMLKCSILYDTSMHMKFDGFTPHSFGADKGFCDHACQHTSILHPPARATTLSLCMLNFGCVFITGNMEFIKSNYAKFKDHAFKVSKVDKFFYAAASFSDAKFALSVFQEDGSDVTVSFSQLFPIDGITCEEKVVKFMKECGEKNWPKVKGNVMVDLAQKVLVPLFGSVVFESVYADLVKNIDNVDAKDIGIGSKSTFHGMPDMRLPGLDVLTSVSR